MVDPVKNKPPQAAVAMPLTGRISKSGLTLFFQYDNIFSSHFEKFIDFTPYNP